MRRNPGYHEPVNVPGSSETEPCETHEPGEPDIADEQHQDDDGEQYEPPEAVQHQDMVPEVVQPHPEPAAEGQFEEIQTSERRSKRIPKLSAKALRMIESEEWHNMEDE